MSYDLAELAARDALLAGRPMPTPSYATRRTPGLASRGDQVAKVAKLLGKPLIPWQRFAADLTTQINPAGSPMFWRYPLVVLVLPRQCGKTTFARPVMVDRCISRPGTDIRTTAQLGKYAAERWEELAAEIESSNLAPFAHKLAGKGSERLDLGGSTIRPFPPTEKSLHSTSPNFVMVDEVWAFGAAAGHALTTAIRPAQITKRDRQLWLISAQGDANSGWLDSLVEAGRASVDDPDSLMCYLEFSPDPDADHYDPTTWEYHPGLGHLITLTDLAGEADPTNNTHAEFLRSFMNLSVRGTSSLVDLDRYAVLGVPGVEIPAGVPYGVGFDVAIDRTAAAVWASWIDPAGLTWLKVVETRPGADWVADFITELHHRGLTCSTIDGAQTSPVLDELTRRNVQVDVLSNRDHAAAWSQLKARITAGTIRHDQSPALTGALQVVAERRFGDHVAPARRASLGPIDPINAALAATHAAASASPAIQIFHL